MKSINEFPDLNPERIDRFVVPLCRLYDHEWVDQEGNNHSDPAVELIGTAFFIGTNGFLLTAAHVIDEIDREGGKKVIMLPVNSQWYYFEVLEAEKHPTEDVAILKVGLSQTSSILRVSQESEFSSCEYFLWGYPEHVAFELQGNIPRLESGLKLTKPEMIYQKGYVRRRISREIPYSLFAGANFYEVSEVAGARCSGSPMIMKITNYGKDQRRLLIGVYVGEQTGNSVHATGFCVRSDAFFDWVPTIAGQSLSSL